MNNKWTWTYGQYSVSLCSDGTLSYQCGSTRYSIIDAYRNNLIEFAGQHPDLTTWQQVVTAYNLQLQPEPTKENA